MTNETHTGEEIWPRYFLRLSYDGTNYHGWQRQPNGHSVQAELEKALRILLRQEKVITTGCGRTDTGVHASDFYVHFNAQQAIAEEADLVYKLNQVLPADMAVHSVFRVKDRAHARFDATSRTYEYHVHQRPDPFVRFHSTYYPWPLDVEAMQRAADLLVGSKDFASFCKTGGAQKTTICRVTRAEWTGKGGHLVFTITADRFLRNMVRAVVGTLFEVGRGKLPPEAIGQILEGKSRSMAGESVKACGLRLVEITYPDLRYGEGVSFGAHSTDNA